ncbi:hypothetical protein D9757_009532 [Collybiopsis confluens]|uniref:DUF1793-domain-containing protein n=1 Tax=Collybiopsis confluens TaxID=2823264 RepID=A0A8H5M2U1_9AGAR|nr:hypothetical protein D9757_009532 [Collybiopsis confluens]
MSIRHANEFMMIDSRWHGFCYKYLQTKWRPVSCNNRVIKVYSCRCNQWFKPERKRKKERDLERQLRAVGWIWRSSGGGLQVGEELCLLNRAILEKMAMFWLTLAALASWSSLAVAAQGIQPPAIPLTVRSPYLQSYLSHTSTTANSNIWPSFWTTNHTLGWAGMVRVDNTPYIWLGAPGSLTIPNGTTLSAATFNSYQVTPTRTILNLTAGKMNINVTFLSPIEASSNDGNSHTVQVYQDISGEWISHDTTNFMQWNTTVSPSILFHEAQRFPFQFMVEGNNEAEDGVVYHVTNAGSGVTYQSGQDVVLRSAFLSNGNLSNTQDTINRAIQDRWPVLAFSADLGSIASISASSPLVWGIGLARSRDIIYTTTAGNQTRQPYFFTKYPDVPTAMANFMSDAQNALKRSIVLDGQIVSDASSISNAYADVVSLATRQAMAGMEITVGSDSSGRPNSSDVMIFMKDLGNSQRTNPVEIMYAAFPSILYINASWAGYLLEPLLAFQSSPLYTQGYAAGDLGNAFPSAVGNNALTPFDAIEDVGDMIIMVWAHARFSGDGGLLNRYYSTLKEWTETLITANPLTPTGFQSADGLSSTNQTNLAIKGILAIRTMAEISTTVGESDDAKKYGALATSLVSQWQTLAGSSGHLTSTYTALSSWGLMYNLYYDKLFGFEFVSDNIYTEQTTWYSNAISSAPAFGFAFDSSQPSIAKSHWTLLTAGTVADSNTRNSLVSMVHSAASNLKNPAVFPTTYGTSDASVISGGARYGAELRFISYSPAQGAMYALLALNLPKKTVSATSLGNGGGGSTKTSNAGAIAGGVVGGLAGLTLLALVILFYRRRRGGGVRDYNGQGDEKASGSFAMIFRSKNNSTANPSQEPLDGYRIEAYQSTPGFTSSYTPTATGTISSHRTPSSGADTAPYGLASPPPMVPPSQTRNNSPYQDSTRRAYVVQNGDGGGERDDGSAPQRPPAGPLPGKISSSDRVPRSQSIPRATGGTRSASEAGSSDVAAELRGEVENLRREMEEMRMRSQYEPPPEYQ